MLQAIRITLSAYTASFRVPHFVGHQLTLPVPPLSTVYGLISAAAGRWIMPQEVEWLAYRCEYEAKAFDLEAIVQIEREKPESAARPKAPPKTRGISQREFLARPRLTLYLPLDWEAAFRRPRYALLLGRTQDVATVESIQKVDLKPVPEGEVSGVLLPFELLGRGRSSAWLHNLPVAFTEGPDRRPLRLQIFGAVDAFRPAEVRNAEGWLVQDVKDGTTIPLYRKEWVLAVNIS